MTADTLPVINPATAAAVCRAVLSNQAGAGLVQGRRGFVLCRRWDCRREAKSSLVGEFVSGRLAAAAQQHGQQQQAILTLSSAR